VVAISQGSLPIRRDMPAAASAAAMTGATAPGTNDR
jgi:hypothetical protein